MLRFIMRRQRISLTGCGETIDKTVDDPAVMAV